MRKQNTEPGLGVTATAGIVLVLFVGLVTILLGGPFFSQPFVDPTAVKTMAALATMIVWFGGVGAVFLPQRRPTVAMGCGAAFVCCYAIGLAVAHS